MASRSDVTRFATANRDIRTLVLRDLRAVWVTLDPSDALGTRVALEAVLPDLIGAYGEVAVTVAADFFDEMRDTARVAGSHGAVLAPAVELDVVRSNTRWAVGPLFGGEGPEAALGRLSQVVDRLTLKPGRDTIARSVARDPSGPRYARVPVGPTCAFCTVVASRGAVYRSEASAGNDFHADCDCAPTPIWSPDDLPAGYDPEALFNQYEAAANAASGGGLKAVVSELRKQQGTN